MFLLLIYQVPSIISYLIIYFINRNPVAQSTDACRGKVGFYNGRHAWEVIWEGPLGTVAVVGISTKDAPLECHGYVGLLGSDEQSWGWNLVDNHLLHNGDTQGHYPLLNNCPKYQVTNCILDSKLKFILSDYNVYAWHSLSQLI